MEIQKAHQGLWNFQLLEDEHSRIHLKIGCKGKMEPCRGIGSVLERQRQEDPMFKAVLGYVARPHLRRKKRRTDGHHFVSNSHLKKLIFLLLLFS